MLSLSFRRLQAKWAITSSPPSTPSSDSVSLSNVSRCASHLWDTANTSPKATTASGWVVDSNDGKPDKTEERKANLWGNENCWPNSAGDVEATKNMGRDSRGRDKCNVSGTMPHPHFKHLRSCIWVDDHNAAKASNGLNKKTPLPQPSFVMYSKDISLILGLREI